MKIALLIVIAVEVIWSAWYGFFTSKVDLIANDSMANAAYFFGNFVAGALIDYAALYLLISRIGKNDDALSLYALIGLFYLSIVTHPVGIAGFFMDSRQMIMWYDLMGFAILALEILVLLRYGINRLVMGLVHRRDGYHQGNT